ncbi:unnamed protein product, partial [Didymodactylos carnosus]
NDDDDESDNYKNKPVYRPENYSSNHEGELQLYEWTVQEQNDDLASTSPDMDELQYNDDTNHYSSDYFLDDMDLFQLKCLLNEISQDSNICLNIHENNCSVQDIIDEQINSLLPLSTDVHIDLKVEIIRLFGSIDCIYPSRTIRMNNQDYLLLAILCESKQKNSAFLRTTHGWVYSDDKTEPYVVHNVTALINGQKNIIDNNDQNRLC